ncbi:hypothetical protein H5410_026083 [Solanum commersonii]|uniref:Uncharacterized protein n=1 Tax=Solanum commersonii TaxID=4109 RepID=A0A9J5YXY0_SOLCO|nr:hypothetical protein H5410_026083 [Solanum commersonii]
MESRHLMPLPRLKSEPRLKIWNPGEGWLASHHLANAEHAQPLFRALSQVGAAAHTLPQPLGQPRPLPLSGLHLEIDLITYKMRTSLRKKHERKTSLDGKMTMNLFQVTFQYDWQNRIIRQYQQLQQDPINTRKCDELSRAIGQIERRRRKKNTLGTPQERRSRASGYLHFYFSWKRIVREEENGGREKRRVARSTSRRETFIVTTFGNHYSTKLCLYKRNGGNQKMREKEKKKDVRTHLYELRKSDNMTNKRKVLMDPE